MMPVLPHVYMSVFIDMRRHTYTICSELTASAGDVINDFKRLKIS